MCIMNKRRLSLFLKKENGFASLEIARLELKFPLYRDPNTRHLQFRVVI